MDLKKVENELKKADLAGTKSAGLIEALGKIADKRAVPPLLKILSTKKANFKIRMQTCAALTVIGDKRAIPVLLEVAEKGYVQGGYTNLREGAAMAYGVVTVASRLGVNIFCGAILNSRFPGGDKETRQ